jgi:hypothetical protein
LHPEGGHSLQVCWVAGAGGDHPQGIYKASIDWKMTVDSVDCKGEFHDQGDVKWVAVRGQLRGHSDTPFGVGCPQRCLVVKFRSLIT